MSLLWQIDEYFGGDTDRQAGLPIFGRSLGILANTLVKMRLNLCPSKAYIRLLTAINAEQDFMAIAPHEMMKSWRLEPHHEVKETFADSMSLIVFDGQTLRLEFVTARMEEPKPSGQPTGMRHVVSRMVLSTNCAVELINQMQQIGAQLAQAGIIKVEQPAKPPVKPS